jgi:hypothetical protein
MYIYIYIVLRFTNQDISQDEHAHEQFSALMHPLQHLAKGNCVSRSSKKIKAK